MDEMRISEELLLLKLIKTIEAQPAENLAEIAGDILGGECRAADDYDFPHSTDYIFVPNEYYGGAFD